MYLRGPVHLDMARQVFDVGNLYLNRSITCAIVGRQPFGGFRMSGYGFKAAGSPEYLLQCMQPFTPRTPASLFAFYPAKDYGFE